MDVRTLAIGIGTLIANSAGPQWAAALIPVALADRYALHLATAASFDGGPLPARLLPTGNATATIGKVRAFIGAEVVTIFF
jgi:hypothetical protein